MLLFSPLELKIVVLFAESIVICGGVLSILVTLYEAFIFSKVTGFSVSYCYI